MKILQVFKWHSGWTYIWRSVYFLFLSKSYNVLVPIRWLSNRRKKYVIFPSELSDVDWEIVVKVWRCSCRLWLAWICKYFIFLWSNLTVCECQNIYHIKTNRLEYFVVFMVVTLIFLKLCEHFQMKLFVVHQIIQSDKVRNSARKENVYRCVFQMNHHFEMINATFIYMMSIDVYFDNRHILIQIDLSNVNRHILSQ